MEITDDFNTLDYEQECNCDRCLEEKKLTTIEATQKVLKKLKNAGIKFEDMSYDRSISLLEDLRQGILTRLCLRG